MSTSKEYLKLKEQRWIFIKVKKQKYNFEPTYYQVIEKNIKKIDEIIILFNTLVKNQ